MNISNANSNRIYQWVNNKQSNIYIKTNFLYGFEITRHFEKIRIIYSNPLVAFLFDVYH